MKTRILLVVIAVMALYGCGGGTEPIMGDTPLPDSPCTNLGDQACSLPGTGTWQVVRCSLTPDGDLIWKVTRQCEHGCKDGLCLTPSGDVADIARAVEDMAGDGTGNDTDTSLPVDLVGEAGPDVCVPDCEGLICGDDGCGGSCGECPKDHVCVDGGADCCMPKCQGKLCGDDGCEGSCGDCPEGSQCNGYNQCAPICVPNCEDKECGADGCDGDCGECPPGKGCGPQGLCTLCVPLCDDKECGDDGCGGSCGACPFGYECVNDECAEPCAPVCAGKDCGDDGCKGSCGTCLPGETCVESQCIIVCEPSCADKECGPDGCGGSCGKCPPWAWCTSQGSCLSDCVAPDCTGKECGSDGCGGSCGNCAPGKSCSEAGLCVSPGGPCEGIPETGWCDGNTLVTCIAGEVFVTDCKSVGKNVLCEWLDAVGSYGCFEQGECVPECDGLACGPDGCGGSCGECPPGQSCAAGECTGLGPCGDIGFEGCCEDNVVLWCDNGILWYMDCNSMLNPEQQQCGWNGDLGFYDCMDEAVEGPDAYPYFCQGACVPSCAFKQCGSDGCGGTCGDCPPGTECKEFTCQGESGDCGGYSEEPACQGDTVVWCEEGKVFFQDCTGLGSFWHCGWVADIWNFGCFEEPCVPECENKKCGDDGCGYVCGYCSVTMFCNDKNQCVYGQGFCGDIDYTGTCDGNVVKWCQNGILQEFDCFNLGPTWQCGWYEDGAYYWCIE